MSSAIDQHVSFHIIPFKPARIYSEMKQVFGELLKLKCDYFWEEKQSIGVTIYS